MQLEYQQAQEIQEIVESIIKKKRILLQIIKTSLKRCGNNNNNKISLHKTILATTQRFALLSNNENESILSNTQSSKKKYESSPDHYFRKQLRKTKLAQENRRNAEYLMKFKMLFINSEGLKEKIINFYLSLIHDLEFLQKFRVAQDVEIFLYMKNKIKHELESAQMALELQEIIQYYSLLQQERDISPPQQICNELSDQLNPEEFDFSSISPYKNNEEQKESFILDFNQNGEDMERNFEIKQKCEIDIQVDFNQSESKNWYSKELLVTTFKNVTVAMIMYYGLQYLQQWQTNPNSQINSLEVRALDCVGELTKIASSTKIFPIILQQYVQMCKSTCQQEQYGSLAFPSFITLITSISCHKLIDKFTHILRRFMKAIFYSSK